MKQKLKDFLTILIIQLVLTIPFYTVSVYGLTISNVKVTKVTSSSATVEWNTDNISNGKVRYGKTTSLGFTQRHDNFIDNHTVTLFNGIDSDTSYFFIVESTDLAGSTAADNNSNNFYTFKTTDITPPPQVTGLRAVSATSNSVFLSWDAVKIADLSHYVIYRNRIPIANSTTNSFNDTGLDANKDYNYKVSAVDNSNNEGPQSDTLIASTSAVDSIAPIISSIDVVTITDTTARITWLTNENATSIVLYGVNKTDKIKSSSDLEINHTIVIDGLTKNAKVLFIVKSCDSSNNCANFSTQSFTAGRDTKPPFINLSIPRCVNRRVIDISGSTEPFSSVTLFVNNMNIPKRSLSSNEVGISGKFIFSQIQLEKDNVIKVVMVDKSGNKAQKIFETSIDTEDPIVQLSEIPSLTSRANVSISGSVNEPVTIKVFVDTNVNESSVPSKITGLNTTKVGQNSIELRWDEMKSSDFSHYVVYRSDIGAIATTKPSNFNLFIDALVDSGKSYTYQVSAVNIFAKEGPKSEPITITTEKSGAILNLNPPLIDALEDFRKPLAVLNATATFNLGVRLTKGDGTYKIKTIIEDCAENSVIIQKDVTLDTKKPEVKITSPPSGAFLFENVANEIDVIGITKPNARVHLFVDRTPFSFFNQSFEISGLPNEIQNLPEAQLDAKCRSSVSASFCRTGADFSVDADSQGNFKFERVDLTTIFGGAARIREVPVTEFRDTQLNPEAQESKKTTLVVIATDKTGQRGVATHAVRIGTCWSGNQSWDIIPLALYQSPTFLSTERMAEGTETIYFYFNYSYVGAGKMARIKNIKISKACSTRELIDPRFNISCQIMAEGNTPILLNPPANTVSYSAMPLSRFPGMERFLEKDWKNFFKAINNELTFPLRLTISYEHDVDGDGKLETEVQRTCEQVSYVLDNAIIDFRNVLPDWMLFDFVDLLQDSVKTIDKLQEQINKVLEFITIGCVSSFGMMFLMGAYRRIVTFTEEKTYLFLTAANIDKEIGKLTEIWQKNPLNTEKPNDQDEQQYCQNLIKQIAKEKKGFKLKYVTDADLRKCFPNSAAAWSVEENTYKFMRYSCDRVFGHASPAGWTKTKKDTEILNKLSSAETCGVDQNERGQPLRAIKCRDVQLSAYREKPENFGVDDICFELRMGNKQLLLQRGDLESGTNDIYQLRQVTGFREFKINYAKKLSENNYLTAAQISCEELCGVKPTAKGEIFIVDGEKAVLNQDPKDKQKKSTVVTCTTVNKCRSYNGNKLKLGNKEIPIEYAYPAGYAFRISKDEKDTTSCFYDGKNPNVVSSSPAEREECCCINGKGEAITHYYQPDDVDPVTSKLNPNEPKYVHESKTKANEPPQAEIVAESTDDPRYADMKWSYRYSKEKFVAINPASSNVERYEYNPKRYIEGRDYAACFGQDSWWDGKNVVTVNPSRDHLAAVQCINLGGLVARLQFVKNIMTHTSTCLIQVRTTGRGDTGACKELFTQYICSGIWQVLRWFIDGCSPLSFDYGKALQDENIIAYLAAGAKGAHASIDDLQSTIASEYGNAKLNDLLGYGEESLARKLCLLAFGYDWELDFKSFVDAAYTTPFATLVQPITKSREFLTVEPGIFKPKYEYRASWLINPGCDFERYEVWLSCVGQQQLNKYPNNINCGALGAPSIGYTVPIGVSVGERRIGGPSPGFSQCDCINLPNEKAELVFAGKLKQNVLEDNLIPLGKRVLTSDVRYDHIKFVLKPDRKIPSNVKSNCFQTGYDDGVFYFPLIDKTARDILDCQADLTQGLFICKGGQLFDSKKGTASFMDIRVNGKDPAAGELVFTAGDFIEIEANIRNVGAKKCLRAVLDGLPEAIPIDEGILQYQLKFSKPLTLGRLQQISAPQGVTVQESGLGNSDKVTIEVRFFSKSNSGTISFDKDLLLVDNQEIKGETLTDGKIITVGSGENLVQISLVEANYLKLRKKNAEILVIGAEISRDARGDFYKARAKDGTEYPSVGGPIQILPTSTVQDLSQSAQPVTKRLKLELFHLKPGQEHYEGAHSCDLNEPVRVPGGAEIKKEINIKVEPRVSTSLDSPQIRNPNYRKEIRVDKDIEIASADILHRDGIKVADLKCKRPDGLEITLLPTISGNRYMFSVDKSQINNAGTYSCELTATSNNPKSNPTKATFDFEVFCGPQNGVYGKCDNEGKCISSGTPITTVLSCWTKSSDLSSADRDEFPLSPEAVP